MTLVIHAFCVAINAPNKLTAECKAEMKPIYIRVMYMMGATAMKGQTTNLA